VLACYISSIFVIDRFVHNYCRPSALPLLIIVLCTGRAPCLLVIDGHCQILRLLAELSDIQITGSVQSIHHWTVSGLLVMQLLSVANRPQLAGTPTASFCSIIQLSTVFVNDFTSSPDQLLDAVLRYRAAGGTDFTAAIKHTQTVMEQNWSTER